MSDIFDYMAWRGDINMTQDGFNEVDNLILSRFSYVPLDGIVSGDFHQNVSIAEATRRFTETPELEKLLVMQEDKRLFEEIGKCKRFADMQLCCYMNIIDEDKDKQFSAVSINLGNGSFFISYRGTDNTLVGWKEDFNMSFLRQVPAQKDAVLYLQKAAAHLEGPLLLGGHSKGGNLAIYAAAFCPQQLQNRITAVYNNDGPWLHADMVEAPGYIAVRDKIQAFIPQTSIVGMLLENEGRYTVIRSTQSGIFQHDLYSWEVLGPRFIYLASITNGSKFVDHTIKSWLTVCGEEQRAKFVDALFQIMSATGSRTFQEMSENWYNSAITMLKTFINMDEDMRKAIGGTLLLLMKAAGKHLSFIMPGIPFISSGKAQDAIQEQDAATEPDSAKEKTNLPK